MIGVSGAGSVKEGAAGEFGRAAEAEAGGAETGGSAHWGGHGRQEWLAGRLGWGV